MPALNSRQVAIIRNLLTSDRPVPARLLGEQTGVTARIVRYNLPIVAFWLSSRDAQLNVEPREGVSIDATGETRHKLLDEVEQLTPECLLLSPDERRFVLIFELLMSADYRTKQSIQNKLSISSSTLYRDLTEIEPWFTANQLFLERRPRLGVRVAGREEDLRQAVVSLLVEFDLTEALLDHCLWDDHAQAEPHDHSLSTGQDFVMEQVEDWDLAVGWQTVSFLLEKLNTRLTDLAQLTLALYWALMQRRFPEGHTVQMPDKPFDDFPVNPEYAAIAQHLNCYLDQKEQPSLPPAETAQFVLLLLASVSDTAGSTFPPAPDVHKAAHRLTQKLIKRIDHRIGTSRTASDVVSRLESHISRSIMRLQHGLPVHSSLNSEVRQAYPDLWQAVKAVLDEDQVAALLPEDEVGFITMYMALASQLLGKRKPAWRVIIACPTGGITVQMLVHRLSEELPELEIVDVISIRQLSEVKVDKADVVISTARFSSSILPVITVSPLINQQDLVLLRSQLGLMH